MCGITGIASRTPVVDRDWLPRARDTMAHRGPDDAGDWWSADGRVGLGHRRLAIVDLSAGGHQPMHSADGSLTLVFNGEIYNYRDVQRDLVQRGHTFRTQSDTEVVLAAYAEWGVEWLARLNGMFALALFDARQQRLVLARDRAGEKPLYYTERTDQIAFASELKALMSSADLPRRVDPESFDHYLAFGYGLPNRSMLSGVAKLPPAHALTFDVETGQCDVWRYWAPPTGVGPEIRGGERALLDQLETLLEDSVRRQLVADVPVGILLSGGIDSSLMAAMAVRSTPAARAFTIRFPGHGTLDETEHARLIARHFGLTHVELDAAEITSPELLPTLARQFDEPLADSSAIPTYLVSRLVREHCKVAIGGDGGDELFGGYTHYDALLRLRRQVGVIPRALRLLPARTVETVLPIGVRGRSWTQRLEVEFSRGLPETPPLFDARTRRRLLGDRPSGFAERFRRTSVPNVHDLLLRATMHDFATYLPDDILVKVDRASMLCSLEVRAPFLDYRIIEFAFGAVPSALKTTLGERKILLKRLAARVLPPTFDFQRKQGFSIPLRSWLRAGSWKDFFADVLLSAPIFDRRFVAELLAGQWRGRSNSERLFSLVMFELWRRTYAVEW